MKQDLRSYIEEVEDILLRIKKPVELEHLSALIVQANQPVVFENIEGFENWQVMDLLFRDRLAQSRVLRCRPDAVLSELAKRLKLPPRDTRKVNDGPVKEIILNRGELDLTALPGFRHGSEDPRPWIIAMIVCESRVSGHVNFAFTRMSAISPNQATYLIGSSPHMRSVLQEWEEAEEPMPLACVIGTHPAYEIMASYSVPEHLEHYGELELVGNLLGEEVEMVPCEAVPLEVPAHAELVIEGWVQPFVREQEGPGPSQALYYLPGVSQQPVFEAEVLTMRSAPILRQHNTIIYSDHQPLLSLPHEALLYERLIEMGKDVHDVLYVPWGGTLACVVQLTPHKSSDASDVIKIVLEERWPNTRLAIVVDNDVDIESAEDLIWSVTTRVDPQTDLVMLPSVKGHPIDPTTWQNGESPRDVKTNKWGIDATKPVVKDKVGREHFTRTLPPHFGELKLKDYL